MVKKINLAGERFGKLTVIGDWIHELGLNRNTVYGRLRRGWEVEAALSAPIGKIR
jgi:hypothetical protein